MAQIKLGNLLWRSHTRPISPEDPVDVKDVNAADIKTKLEMVQSELALVKAELQEIKANQLSGDQKVQLSGTLVSEAVVDALALTDTHIQYRDGGFNLLRDLDEVSIEATNTLNTSVRLFFRLSHNWAGIWGSTSNSFSGGYPDPVLTIPITHGHKIILSSHPLLRLFIEEAKAYNGGNIGFAFSAATAPTSGSLTIRILGRRRATYA